MQALLAPGFGSPGYEFRVIDLIASKSAMAHVTGDCVMASGDISPGQSEVCLQVGKRPRFSPTPTYPRLHPPPFFFTHPSPQVVDSYPPLYEPSYQFNIQNNNKVNRLDYVVELSIFCVNTSFTPTRSLCTETIYPPGSAAGGIGARACPFRLQGNTAYAVQGADCSRIDASNYPLCWNGNPVGGIPASCGPNCVRWAWASLALHACSSGPVPPFNLSHHLDLYALLAR